MCLGAAAPTHPPPSPRTYPRPLTPPHSHTFIESTTLPPENATSTSTHTHNKACDRGSKVEGMGDMRRHEVPFPSHSHASAQMQHHPSALQMPPGSYTHEHTLTYGDRLKHPRTGHIGTSRHVPCASRARPPPTLTGCRGFDWASSWLAMRVQKQPAQQGNAPHNSH